MLVCFVMTDNMNISVVAVLSKVWRHVGQIVQMVKPEREFSCEYCKRSSR